MKDREVVIFTLLEGEVIKGIITAFSRYEITVHLKGGVLVTILRHSVYDLRNKRQRCFLKSFQERHRDWEKNDLYVS
jgi:sRNA-binding regulator protein Hfq